MEILRRYGIGTNLQRLLYSFWDKQAVVTKAGKFFGRLFRTDRGVKQGDLASLTIFNIVVDAVARAVMLEVYGPQEAYHGLGWASL